MSRNLDGRDSLAGLDRWIQREEPDYGEEISDPSPEEERDDAIDALQQAGMEPMDTAPHDREITVVTEAKLLKQRVFWQDGIFGDGSWMDVDGDGATDSTWRQWDTEELIGWLP